MKIFQFEWNDYEDVCTWLFSHPINKTNREFRKDCIKAIREVGEEYMNQEEGWINARSWMEFAVKKLVEYNYKLIIPDTTYSFFGCGIVEYEEKNQREDDKKWRHIVGKKLFDRAVELNTKIENEMRKHD